LSYVQQSIINNFQDIEKFLSKLQNLSEKSYRDKLRHLFVCEPCILKTLYDTLCKKNYLCETPEQTKEAFERISSILNGSSTDLLSIQEEPTMILIQEFINGDEFIVDTVSLNGKFKNLIFLFVVGFY